MTRLIRYINVLLMTGIIKDFFFIFPLHRFPFNLLCLIFHKRFKNEREKKKRVISFIFKPISANHFSPYLTLLWMHELTFSIVLCIIIVFTIRLFLCLINIVRAWNYIFWVDGKWRNERRKKLRDEQNQMMHKYYADYNNRGNEISKFFFPTHNLFIGSRAIEGCQKGLRED